MNKTSATTYTKLRDGSWGLRIAGAGAGSAKVGQRVTVAKRDGSSKTEIVGRILWSGQGVTLATISANAHNGGGSRSRSGSRYCTSPDACEQAMQWDAPDRLCRACARFSGEDY